MDEQEIIEPEVLDNENAATPEKQAQSTFGRDIVMPIAAGLFTDTLDFVTFGPFGLKFGMLAGGLAALYLCWASRVPRALWLYIVIAASVYCSVPRTEALPIATIIAVISVFKKAKDY